MWYVSIYRVYIKDISSICYTIYFDYFSKIIIRVNIHVFWREYKSGIYRVYIEYMLPSIFRVNLLDVRDLFFLLGYILDIYSIYTRNMLDLYLIYTSKFLENYTRYRVYIEYISGIYQVYIKYICYQETTDIEDFILDTYSIYTRFILGAPLLFLVVTPNIYSIYPRYILDIYPILTFFSILDMLLTFWSMRSIHTRHTRFILDLYSIYTMYYYDTRFILAHVLDTYLSVHH